MVGSVRRLFGRWDSAYGEGRIWARLVPLGTVFLLAGGMFWLARATARVRYPESWGPPAGPWALLGLVGTMILLCALVEGARPRSWLVSLGSVPLLASSSGALFDTVMRGELYGLVTPVLLAGVGAVAAIVSIGGISGTTRLWGGPVESEWPHWLGGARSVMRAVIAGVVLVIYLAQIQLAYAPYILLSTGVMVLALADGVAILYVNSRSAVVRSALHVFVDGLLFIVLAFMHLGF